MVFLTFLLFWISGVLHRRPGAACAAKKMIPRRDRRRRRAGCRSVRSETFVDSLGGLFVRLRRRGLCRESGALGVTRLPGERRAEYGKQASHTQARGDSDLMSGGMWKIEDFPHTPPVLII